MHRTMPFGMGLVLFTLLANLCFLLFLLITSLKAGRPVGIRLLPLVTPGFLLAIAVGCTRIDDPCRLRIAIWLPQLLRKVSQLLQVLTFFNFSKHLSMICSVEPNYS